MLLFNLADIIIIAILIFAIIRGLESGILRQALSAIGFFAGLLVGILLAPKLAVLGQDQLTRGLISLAVTLVPALVLSGGGELLGLKLAHLAENHHFGPFDAVLGSVFQVATTLIAVWLVAAFLATLPFNGFKSQLADSVIITRLDALLPPAPPVISQIEHVIAPNGFPRVFTGQEPDTSSQTPPDLATLAAVINRDAPSVVKIEGRGCGGIVEGSGFVAGPGLVATNAHVVAGVGRPMVLDGAGTHSTEVVWFDPNLDLAVLRVGGLVGSPLAMVASANIGTPGAALGYPGGGKFTPQPAVISDQFEAEGQDIYDQNPVVRSVYDIQADIEPGNSGGPLIDASGRVIGLVFAKSLDHPDHGYALVMAAVISEIHQAAGSTTPVSTGSCAS